MPPGRKPGRGGRGGGRGGRGKAAKETRSATSYTPEPEEVAAALPAIQEDVWVQCDACQKWRRLPPGSVVADDASWYCTMNPDQKQNNCNVPEENYDAEKEVVIASTDPFYAGLVNKDADELRRELLLKAGFLPEDTPVMAGRRRGQTPDPGLSYDGQGRRKKGQQGLPTVSYLFGSLKEELAQLVQACHQLVVHAGKWTGISQQTEAGSKAGSGFAPPPPWVWSGLAHFAPEAAKVAAQASEVATALQYFAGSSVSGGVAGGVAASGPSATSPTMSEQLAHAQSLAQLALLNAACLALPKVQSAAADPSSIVLPTPTPAPTPAPALAMPGGLGSSTGTSNQPAMPPPAAQLPTPPPAIPMPALQSARPVAPPQAITQLGSSPAWPLNNHGGGLPGLPGMPQQGSQQPIVPGAALPMPMQLGLMGAMQGLAGFNMQQMQQAQQQQQQQIPQQTPQQKMQPQQQLTQQQLQQLQRSMGMLAGMQPNQSMLMQNVQGSMQNLQGLGLAGMLGGQGLIMPAATGSGSGGMVPQMSGMPGIQFPAQQQQQQMQGGFPGMMPPGMGGRPGQR